MFFCVTQYKVCYNQVVAEVREDTEESGTFDLPEAPLMETYVVTSCRLHSAFFVVEHEFSHGRTDRTRILDIVYSAARVGVVSRRCRR